MPRRAPVLVANEEGLGDELLLVAREVAQLLEREAPDRPLAAGEAKWSGRGGRREWNGKKGMQLKLTVCSPRAKPSPASSSSSSLSPSSGEYS
jgi:hypothetical protein